MGGTEMRHGKELQWNELRDMGSTRNLSKKMAAERVKIYRKGKSSL